MMNASNYIEVQLQGRLGQFLLDARFQAPMQGVTALFGPSGCGKTTVLRSIAGLQKIPGRISVGNAIWQDRNLFMAPYKRPVGYVFQESILFPHLSVHENLLYGQRRAKNVTHRIHADEVIALLGLSQLIKRHPENLSGGERRSEEHTSELQSRGHLVCRLLLEKKKKIRKRIIKRGPRGADGSKAGCAQRPARQTAESRRSTSSRHRQPSLLYEGPKIAPCLVHQ